MKKKLLQLNQEVLAAEDAAVAQHGVEEAGDLDDLFSILADQTDWHVAEFPAYCLLLVQEKLLQWPTSKVLPVLDMVRMLMLHQDAVDKLVTSNAMCTAALGLVAAADMSDRASCRNSGISSG